MVDQFVIGDLAIKIGIVPVAERRSKKMSFDDCKWWCLIQHLHHMIV